MRRKIVAGLLAGVWLAACTGSDSPGGTGLVHPDAPAEAGAIQGKYIVVYKAQVSDARAEILRNVDTRAATVERVYQYALRGWSGELSPSEVTRLRADPRVAYVEPDQVVHASSVQTPTPSWGLDRIDQRNLPRDASYTYVRTGVGVHFYGIDTGILYTHDDFGGRAIPGFDSAIPSTGGVDCSGHGSHTASTAGGTLYGVAKAMTIVGVRVLDCFKTGSTSSIVAGVDWVTQNAIKPAVANMSIDLPFSQAMTQAIENSVASGVVYVVAAGNNVTDACNVSPAAAPNAITVGAIDSLDNQANFSNFGPCVDIFAPGQKTIAATLGSNSAFQSASGTSMATAHVSGVVGLYLETNPTATPAQVTAAIVAGATSGVIKNLSPNTVNKLLYTGFIAGPSNQSPTATITAPASNASFVSGTSVAFAGSGNDPEDGVLAGGSLVWTSSRDGQIGTGTAFARSNLSLGVHTITLTARDAQNATGTFSRTITITPPANQSPTAAITAPVDNASFVVGTSVSFAGTGSDPEDGALAGASLVWTSSIDFQIGTGTSFSTAGLSVGTHTITLTARDAQNATGSITRTITITAPANQAPTAAITAPVNNTSFVAGAPVAFAGTGTDPEDGVLTGGSLVWTSSRDGQIGTGTGFSRTTLSVGIHTITLTVRDAQNAAGTAIRTITITPPANQAPTATITAPANGASFIAGATVSFAGTGNDPESGVLSGEALVWTSSLDGQIGTRSSFSRSTLSVGIHTITLTARDPQGASGTATLTLTITAPVNQPPTAQITAPAGGASFVTGTSVSFAGSGSDPEDGALSGASLVWTSSLDGQIGTGTGFSKSNLSVGVHTITLTARDAQSATGLVTRTLTITAPVNQPPTAQIAAPSNGASFAAGAPVTFAGSGSDPEDGTLSGPALVWTSSRDGPIGIGTGFVTTTLSQGTHTITLVVRDAQNAIGLVTRTLTITAPAPNNQPPTAVIVAPAAGAGFIAGAPVGFSGSGADAEDGPLSGGSLVWTSSRDGPIGTGASFSRSNLSVGTHTITLTVQDAQNATGTATRTIAITAPGNQPPVATITAPFSHSIFAPGASVLLEGTGIDPEDGQLSGASLVWTGSRDGVLGTGASLVRSDLTPGVQIITLTVKDSQGLTGSAARSISIMVLSGAPRPGGVP